MATIVTSYNYPDGNVLVPNSHNQNIASNVSGEGILSEPNGGLGVANLDAGFRISPEHIQAGQACRSGQEVRYETIDILSDAFSSANEVNWTPIPGLGIRFKQPYFASCLFLQWSVFYSPLRVIYNKDQDPSIIPTILLRTYYQGLALSHTLRAVPWTVLYAPGGVPVTEEDRACVQQDMSHLVRNISAGWHNLSVRVYIERVANSSGNDLLVSPLRRSINGNAVDVTHKVYSRLTVGIGNVRHNTFL